MNRTVLVGRLTRDVELKYTQHGKAVANFTIAVNRPFKNAQGETDADFIMCQSWGKRYRLRLPFIKNGMGYLNEFQSNDFFIGDKHHVYEYKTIFTESEIEELKRKYNLDSFILEEVKEDE